MMLMKWPVQVSSLVSAVRAAVRDRRRQLLAERLVGDAEKVNQFAVVAYALSVQLVRHPALVAGFELPPVARVPLDGPLQNLHFRQVVPVDGCNRLLLLAAVRLSPVKPVHENVPPQEVCAVGFRKLTRAAPSRRLVTCGRNHATRITLYHRTYPVKGAPVSLSLVPFAAHQKHTFTVGSAVHEAECKELEVVVPDDASVVADKQKMSWAVSNLAVLSWTGEQGPVKSTAQEVFDLAHTKGSGFRMAK